MSKPKIVIVHDWLYGGGAELVVEQLHKLYPDAPIYASYCSDEWRKLLDDKVITGYLQGWPFSRLRKFLPVLRQHWFRNLDLSEYDIVISSCGNGEARFACVKKPAIHISYTHTPTHFYWSKYEEYLATPSFKPKWLARTGLKTLVRPLRKRDYEAAQKVDYLIANSSHIQDDIKKYYGRDSEVIHPPVNVAEFGKKQKAEKNAPLTFISWGRHVPYKRFDLAVRACNQLKVSLVIIGDGPETEALKKIAGPTVTFTGRAPHDELVKYARSADAFLFPGEEDFGIAPVEALAAGLPIIAFNAGGARDFVIPGKTGVFFEEQTVESLVEAMENFKKISFDSNYITQSASQFSPEEFTNKIKKFIKSKLSE